MGDKTKGILVFDNLGNFINLMEIPSNNFDFAGDELYFLAGDHLVFNHLYSNQARQLQLPLTRPEFAQILGNRVALIQNHTLWIYSYKP
jgi:hypothetical protein